jgi:hypothetical protein
MDRSLPPRLQVKVQTCRGVIRPGENPADRMPHRHGPSPVKVIAEELGHLPKDVLRDRSRECRQFIQP